MKKLLCVVICVGLLQSLQVVSADESPAGASRIDGVPVDAIEALPNSKAHELSLDAGIYPFNPYYNGLSVGAGYAYNFSNTFGWEVIHAEQYFAVEKGLTAELADKYQVNPLQIEKLRYTFSSDMTYTFANGKLAFVKDYIRYFRGAMLLGPGLVNTSQRNNVCANFGAFFEFFTGDTFAWKFEARDSLSFGGVDNVLTVSLGTGIRF